MKVAVITYNTNNKDKIREIGHYRSDWDYFCFTDDPKFHHLVYEPIFLEKIEDWETAYRRIIKTRWLTHKEKQLQGYDIHVVHDGNIQIISNLQPLIEKATGGFYILDHWLTCVYQAIEGRDEPAVLHHKFMDALTATAMHAHA